jgi:hypothetical protein
LGSKDDSDKNVIHLRILLSFLVEMMGAGDSPSCELNKTIQFLLDNGIYSSLLNLDSSIMENLLMCTSDSSNIASYFNLLTKLESAITNLFPRLDKPKIRDSFLAARHNMISYSFDPNDVVKRSVDFFSFPFKFFFSHNFDSNLQIETFYDFSINKDFLIVKANRNIDQNEILTLNYENKGHLIR